MAPSKRIQVSLTGVQGLREDSKGTNKVQKYPRVMTPTCSTEDCKGSIQFRKDYKAWCSSCYWRLRDSEDKKLEEEKVTFEAENKLEAEQRHKAKVQEYKDQQLKEANKTSVTVADKVKGEHRLITEDWRLKSCTKCNTGDMNLSGDELTCWQCGHIDYL